MTPIRKWTWIATLSGRAFRTWRHSRPVLARLVLVAMGVCVLVARQAAQPHSLELVSRQSAADGGARGNGDSVEPSLSFDGNQVAFTSGATNLIPGGGLDANLALDVFMLDRTTGSLELVSRQTLADGGAQANSASFTPAISRDGRHIAFTSAATNLIPGGGPDVNGIRWDIFVFDRATQNVELVSRQAAASGGAQADFDSFNPTISGDGNYVAFASMARNLGGAEPDGLAEDIFVLDRQTGDLDWICRQGLAEGGAAANDNCSQPSISADGRYVAFSSRATNLIPGAPGGAPDANGNHDDVFVFDRTTRQLVLISRQDIGDGGSQAGPGGSKEPAISGDGRYVAFTSRASNLAPGGGIDVNGVEDVFVYDRSTQRLELVSREDVGDGGAQGNDASVEAVISDDGRFVAFKSFATNLIPGNLFDATGPTTDVFLFDRSNATLQLVSRRAPADGGQQANNRNQHPALSGDGHSVAFASDANNLTPSLPDVNFSSDVFVTDFEDDEEIVADAGPDQLLECTNELTPVQLNGSGSQPPVGLSYTWTNAFGTASGVGPLVSLPVGVHAITLTVEDGNGRSASDVVSVHVRDTTAPTIVLDPEVRLTATSIAGAAHTVTPNVTDACDPATQVVVNPDLSMFPPGETTVTVTATDEAGNAAQATQRVIVTFACTGFEEPVENPPAVNTGTAGRTYPLKWQCFNGQGGVLADLSIVESLEFTQVSCAGNGASAIPMEADDAGQSGLRLSGDRFVFGWTTPRAAGCYRFVLGLSDGTKMTAVFELF